MAAAVAASAWSPTARADDEPPARPPLHWDPAWTHAGPWDYAVTGVGLTTLGLETLLLQGRSESPRWDGPILFDTPVRNLLRSDSPDTRALAANVSWGLWFALVGYPVVVDIPYAWVRFGPDVAWDLLWQDAAAMSLAGAVDFALRDSIARVRPYNSDCLAQGGKDCLNGPETTRSFPSGHVAETTTATALICTQHLKMRLYGTPWDAVTCASAVAADAAVGTLRMMADDHYASDVIAGAALGAAFGWGVPVLMHMHGHTEPPGAGQFVVSTIPVAFSRGGGVGLVGLF